MGTQASSARRTNTPRFSSFLRICCGGGGGNRGSKEEEFHKKCRRRRRRKLCRPLPVPLSLLLPSPLNAENFLRPHERVAAATPPFFLRHRGTVEGHTRTTSGGLHTCDIQSKLAVEKYGGWPISACAKKQGRAESQTFVDVIHASRNHVIAASADKLPQF